MPFDPNRIDAALADDNAMQARIGLRAVGGTSPDREAEARRLARTTNRPVEAVRQDPEPARADARVLQFGPSGMTMAPVTTRFLANKDNARIAHDDTDNLSGWEKGVNAFKKNRWGASTSALALNTLGLGARVIGTTLDSVGMGPITEEDATLLWGKKDPAQLKRYLAGEWNPSKGVYGGDWFGRAARLFTQDATDILKNADDPTGLNKLKYATLNPREAAWASPERLAQDAMAQVPALVALAATARTGRVAGMEAAVEATAAARVAGATEAAAAAAGATARRTAMVETMAKTGAVSEGAITTAQNYDSAKQDVMGLKPEVLAKSPEYQVLLKAGYDEDVARIIVADRVAREGAIVSGVAATVGGAVGGAILGKVIGEGGGIALRTGRGFLGEGLQEVAQEPAGQLGQNIAMQRANPDQDLGQGVLESAVAGFAMGGMMGGSIAAINRNETHETAKALDGQEAAATLKNLHDLSAASKVLQRDPQTFQDFVKDNTADGPLEHVWVDGAALAQAIQAPATEGAEPSQAATQEALAKLSPEVRGQIEQAIALGQDVQIPTDQFMAIAGTPLAQSLLPHLKTDPNGYSQKGAEEFIKTQGERLKADVEKVLAQQDTTDEYKASADRVKTEFVEQFSKANRFTPDVNEIYASTASALYVTQAKRLGMTPEKMLEQYPLHINAEGIMTPGSLQQGETRTTTMHPDDFLALTASTAGVDLMKSQVDPYDATKDDPTKPLFVTVDDTGRVVGHDGRHRAARMANAGMTDIPVRVKLANRTSITAGEEIRPQRSRSDQMANGSKPFTLRDIIEPAPQEFAQGTSALEGLPVRIKVDGKTVEFGPHLAARQAAETYMREAGLPYAPPTDYAKVDVERAKRIADAYDAMANDPNDPDVKAAYDAMINETLAQWEAIKATGLQVEFNAPGVDPYGNPRNAILDVTENNHLWVFPTDEGFGSSTDTTGNPLLANVPGETISGRPVQVNDIFRIVHDYFGHIKEGVGFRAEGEENAWRQHSAMYSELARKAMTTETRGQNSWVNYGPNGEANQTASAGDTVFAPQKIGLLPDWVVTEGSGQETLQQFAGQSAEGADIASLELAKQQETQGVIEEDELSNDPELAMRNRIRQDTGWFKGEDGQWRYEISDEDAEPMANVEERFSRAAMAGENYIRLNSVMKHNALYKAYPFLRELPVGLVPKTRNFAGAVAMKKSDGSPVLLLNERLLEDGNEREFMRTAVHEVQHLIQQREGFAVGASADYKTLAESDYAEELAKEFAITKDEQVAAERVYRRSAGEREARDVEARLKGSESWRKGYAPMALRPTVAEPAVSFSMPGVPSVKMPVPAALAQGKETARGLYNPQTSTITILKNADLSTVLHELGHHQLEVLAKMAALPNAPAEIVGDMNTILKWFMPNMTLEMWNGMSLDQQRPFHEKFARGFEAYLFEGKAPNAELRPIFQRVRSWMVQVYKDVRALNVTMTPEVRGVFDRLLAVDEEIAQAEMAAGYDPVFKDAAAAGMTEAQWRDYQQLGAEATASAEESLQARSLRDMRWLSGARSRKIKELQAEAAAKRKSVKAEVTAEVMAEPVNQARQFLKRGMMAGEPVEGPHKLSLPELRDMYDGTYPVMADYTALGYGKYGMLAEEGMHPEQVAELFGYGSGDAMIRDLLSAPAAAEKIDGITDQRMLERYGDLTDQDSIERAADAALHNDARMKFVASEMNALATAAGKPKILATAARAFAGEMVARLKVRDLKPSRFSSAERKASQEAAKAAAKGDLVAAATQKRNQLINGYATKATHEAQAEVEKILRYFAKFDNDGTRKALDPDYRDQIDALLERFDLRRGVSLKEIEKRKSLAAWVDAQREMGHEPVIPDELLNDANRKHFKDMSLEEIRGLRDAVKNVEHLGRLKQTLLTLADKRAFAAVVEEAGSTIEANALETRPDKLERNTLMDVVQGGVEGFFAAHRKFSSLIHQMGGFKEGGPLWEFFVRNQNKAADTETSMIEASTVALDAIFKPIFKQGKSVRQKLFIPEINASLSLEGRLMVALNWGNETNRARVMDGDKWDQTQVEAILATLTPENWDFVEQVWDHIDSYWPAIAAKQRRVTGVTPEKVAADGFTNPLGREMKGGYFPIKYDPDRSERAAQDNVAETLKASLLGAYTAATTRRGHTKARVEKVERPMRKDFGVIFQHVAEVTHDLAWHEYLIDANRLLKNPRISTAIRNHYGPAVYHTMKKAIEDMATGSLPAADAVEKGLNYLRSGATIAGLGWNLTTALMQPIGLTQSMARIGPKWVAKGLTRWLGSPKQMQETITFIHDRSEFMRLRAKTQQREISEIRNKVSPTKNQALGVVEDSFFYLIGKMQMVADVPTWLGQYEKQMALGLDEAKAAALADQAVTDAQGGGQIKDLSQVQRGSAAMKLFTNFYSYMNVVHNLMAESVARTRKDPKGMAPRLVADTLLLMVIPTLMTTLLRAAMKGDDDDLLSKIIKDQIGMPLGLMVGVRELGGLIGSEGRYSGPAGMKFFAESGKLYQQVEQGEVDAAALKAANNVAGVLFHYPAGQVQRTLTGIQALADGTTKNPMAILAGPPPKK